MKLLIYLVFIFNCTSIFAQRDTAFWFAAPDFTYQFQIPVQLNITTYGLPSIVTISQPAGFMTTQVISVPANSTQIVNLSAQIDTIECKPYNTIINTGLKITATQDISLYYENSSYLNPELYLLKGKNALGTDFWISSQNSLDNSQGYQTPPINSSFNIIATENNTIVTIVPSNDIVGHLANISFTITLNKGQTYAAHAVGFLPSDHLHGSHVTSTKPIAITLNDDLLNMGGCADIAGDQTIPVSQTGTEYIAVKGGLNSPFDKVYIMATQNGTTVNQDGVFLTSLNAGASFETLISNNSTYIQANNPIYVYHLSGIGCEVGSAILPQINCSGSSNVSFVRTTTEDLQITIMVQAGGQNNFLVNGVTGVITTAQFTAVPGTASLWYATKIILPLATYSFGSVVTISNTTNLFHIGVLQGGPGSGTSFGFFSDFNIFNVIASATSTNLCLGDTLKLNATSGTLVTYNWVGPNGFTSTLPNPIITNVGFANAGMYILTSNINNCGTNIDTVLVTVNGLPTVSANNATICNGEYGLLTASGANTYLWLPNNITANSINVNPSVSTIYTIIGFNGANCFDTAFANISVNPKPTIAITAGTNSICEGKSTTLTASGGATYTWSPIAGLNNSTIATPVASPIANATYTTIGTDANGCTNTASISIIVKDTFLKIFNVDICESDIYYFGGNLITASGSYSQLFASAAGCDSFVTQNITIRKLPKPIIKINTLACTDEVVTITIENFMPNANYNWNTDGGTILSNIGDSIITVLWNNTGTKNIYVAVTNVPCLPVVAIASIFISGLDVAIQSINSAVQICNGASTFLYATKTNNVTYTWEPTGYSIADSINYFKGKLANSQWVKVIATNENNCEALDSIFVTVPEDCCQLTLPSVFSPNGDNINDEFGIIYPAGIQFKSLSIYNRFGEKVFFTNSINSKWDGQHKNTICDIGVYYYITAYNCNGSKEKILKGDITLIR